MAETAGRAGQRGPGAVAGPAPMISGGGPAGANIPLTGFPRPAAPPAKPDAVLPPPPAPAPPSPLPAGYEPRPVVYKGIKRPLEVPKKSGGPTYWSDNRWGAAAKPTGAPAPQDPRDRRRAEKHFQPPLARIEQPDASVFATLDDLETLMRATLGALANFNEDERMILVKQLRKEGERARQMGEYSPPGLINVPQFRHAFKKFSIRVSEDQARAMFIKYGCDTQGLLPLDMFAAKLLASPARLLAMEPEQKGPYKSGRDASFKGKIVYRYCRRPVFPPSNWDGTPAIRSAKKPKAGLKLEYVYGYAGHNNTAHNLYWTADFKLVYYLAALGIVYDPVTHTQQFYEGHDNDIRCLAMHPNRTTVATGQMAQGLDAEGDGVGDAPYACVWDTTDVTATIRKIPIASDGEPAGFIVALAFSADGTLLIIVTGDTKHTLYIYDLAAKVFLYQAPGYQGTPPSVYGIEWNSFYRLPLGGGVAERQMFVTHGRQHLKIWTLDMDTTRKVLVSSVMGKFGKYQVHDVMSAIFINAEQLVTGAQDGRLLVWDVANTTTCIQEIKNAHAPGDKAPSLYDNQPTLQGVRALCLRAGGTELCSGGSDGVVYCWDLSSGSLGAKPRIVKKIELQEVGEGNSRCSFRSLDARPGSLDLVGGTSRCEIWDLSKDIPEILVQGHTDTVLGVAFHPKRPHKFATVCDSYNVYLWNAKRRQLIAKVGIGVAARSVIFSPNGAHLAIGTLPGGVKVLAVESLTTRVAEMHHAKEEISALKYSPDGSRLAAGSHDNFIYIYNTLQGYQKVCVCKGHSSYITHLDWSVDSRILQSNCGAYELLYFEAATGKLIYRNQRDAMWDSWTCVLGFPVMGIWQKDTDGTDINACCRSFSNPEFQETDCLAGEGEYVAAAYDDGRVRLFNFPCVIEHAPHRAYVGHASHIMGIRFSPDNQYVVSVGGYDRGAMQWRVLATAHDDVVVERPDFGFKVYQAPKKQVMELDAGGLVAPAQPVLAPGEDPNAAAAEDARRKAELEKARRANLCQYEITTKTSNIKGGGTDCGVFMNIIGDKKASGLVVMENAPDNFSRGKVDVFTLDLPDMGNLTRLMVGHDGKGNQQRWHLEGVTVTNKTLKTPSVYFPCGMWFAKDIGDGLTTRTLTPGGVLDGAGGRRYLVAVKTSNLKGCGTDASVYLQLFGEGPDKQSLQSANFKLDNSPTNFTRDALDKFEVDAAVGHLTHIKIGHDNHGLAPSWHLQDVLVSTAGLPDMHFVANRWLSTDETLAKDKQTYVTLYPDTGQDAGGGVHNYRIHVFTSDIKGAGTDANVTIIMFGSNGLNTGKVKLDSSKNNFERGTEDIFYHNHPDLGDILEVEIEHDNKGFGPSWHCQEVVIFDTSTTPNKRFAFPCDRWLAVDEDDGQIRRRLKLERGGETTNYLVKVFTSDIKGAGTDANVSCYLCGVRDGQELWGSENKLNTSKNDFERGKMDQFWLKKHRNLGQLTQLRILHDNAGMGPGWHLDHVEVIDDATGEDYFFPCGMWFDRTEGDKQIDRILKVAVRDMTALQCQYSIDVYTSDVKFAGTDANVHIQIKGELNGQEAVTPVTRLSSSKNNFERNTVDHFDLTLPNVGVMKRIRIGHDNSGLGADWHLNMVEIRCVQTGQFARFHYNDWLSPPKVEVELSADGEAQVLPSRYTIKVYTSDIRYAGTDANVHIVMHGEKPTGEKCKSPALTLANSKNNFERAQEDEFVVETFDVGKLTMLEIGHDNSGAGAAWHLEHVEVWQAGGSHYYFWADQWLDKAAGTDVIFLYPTSGADQKQLYKVSVQTGDVRGAGTDADISVILISDTGESQEMKLDNSKNNFERNMLDHFTLDLGKQNLGRIHTLDIGFATHQTMGGKLGSLFGKAWNLQMVEVAHLNAPEEPISVFVYDDWVTGEKRRVRLKAGQLGANNTYKISVTTSDIRGAGTDSNVTICLCGTRDGLTLDSGDQKLDDSKNNFERGTVDKFMLKTIDVGELTSVVVKSDGSGFGAAWHLDQVEVFDVGRAKSVVFPCGEWLDPKDPMSLTKTLLPRGVSGLLGGLVTYNIAIRTSDVRGAGTDADVTIELYGETNHTPAIKLDTNANNFERNMTDRFQPKAIDVGPLTHIFISKTGGGLGGDWHLQEVEIFHPVVQKTYIFMHNDWLKGVCRVKLEPGKVPENGRCTYRVEVFTADERGAGTDANVTMVLTGEKGDTGERKLDSSANDFERGKTDTFYLEAPDIGRFRSLLMAHDNSGFGAAWKLAKVVIVNTNTGENATFPCNRWLDKEHGLSVLLTPDRDGDGIGDALEGGPETDYVVTIYTSDMRGAGTDANVYLEMYGDKGSLGERRLDDSKNNFERNQRDVFRFRAADVGELQRLVIRHDNTGISPDWHLQQIEVYSGSTGKTYFFACNAWLKKEGGDMSGCRKELLVGNPDSTGPTNYHIEVYTSDLRGAGTDADVSIVIYGEKGDTGERMLDNAGKNNFERGMTDVFFLTSPNVGKMHKIKVRSSGSGLGAAWHLARIVITSSATGEKLPFPFNNWIDKEHGLEHIIWPDRDGDGIGDVDASLGGLVKYRVTTYTSDIRGAGTDANVSVEIHGDKAFIGATRLETRANNFERGQKDEFEVTGSDVGQMTKIVIGHDNSGIGASWHLAQVEVFHPVLQQLHVFPCNEWLEYDSKKGGLDNCKRELLTGALAAASGLTQYKVMVKTSNERGAGTDANVYLTIYGPKGDSGEQELSSSSNDFERNKLDTFILKSPDVGEPDRIRIRSDGGGLGSAWHLEKIDIISSATNTSYCFPFNNWIDDKNGLEHIIWRDGVQGTSMPMQEYRVTVYTSDIRGAGTDANVFMEMHGDKGSVGKNRLETHGNNFERASVDQFVVKGTDIGDIQRIVVWHDNSGPGPAWHLQQVEVFNPATQRTYFFPCNAWLEKTRELGDAGCRKELFAGGAGAGAGGCRYKMEVKTSDVRGAGTDANVTAQVFGTLGDTGEQKLDDSKNNFERNMLDTFFFEAPDIGDIASVILKCDGSGLGAAWHLDYVTITNMSNGKHAKFVYKAWFDDQAGWQHTLYPEGQGPVQGFEVPYRITVYTSDVRGAGTDGDVHLRMKGPKGATGETQLESARNNFERNQIDVFEIKSSEVGPVEEITVRLVERGVGAAWHFREIEVLNLQTGAVSRFVYNDWLQKSEANPTASVTLKEVNSAEMKAARTKVQWRVVTQTSNLFGAGTDASIMLQVWGPNGILGGSEICLDNSKNNFERNALDTFHLEYPVEQDPGYPISKIVIERQQSMTAGADWHLDWIEVTDLTRGHTYKWRCGYWFSKSDGLKKEWSVQAVMQGLPLQLELVEAPAGPEKPLGTTSVSGDFYKMEVHTSDKFGAGTDASVRMCFTDAQGQLWQPTFAQDPSMFQRKCVAHLEAASLFPFAELVSCRVWLDEQTAGWGDAWHLDHLLVTHLPSNRAWRFDWKNWVPSPGGATMSAQVVNDVPQTGGPPERSDLSPVPDQAASVGGLPITEYSTSVFTGDKMGAGTDALITMEITGTWGKVQHSFDQAAALFEKGKRDDFVVRVPDCGALHTLRVWHDGSGFGSDWFLDRIRLSSATHNCTWEAVFNTWIKGGEDKAQTQPLTCIAGSPPTGPPPPPPPPPMAGALTPEQERVMWSRSALKPGDPGIHPQVLAPAQFGLLPAMQHGPLQQRLSQDLGQPKEPATAWQEHTAPHPQDPTKTVTYYHNPGTGVSTYDKPAEYAAWEADHQSWTAATLARKAALEPGARSAGPPQGTAPLGSTGAVPPRVPRPGEVLAPSDFHQLPGMQPGDVSKRLSRRPSHKPEPTCEWQAFTVPHPRDAKYTVDYYYNARTGTSTYDKPPEYAAWEELHRTWVSDTLKRTPPPP